MILNFRLATDQVTERTASPRRRYFALLGNVFGAKLVTRTKFVAPPTE
jgi:hypothetical protein